MEVPTVVLIGIGSNMPWGGRTSVDIVQAACEALQPFAAGAMRRSSLYRTSPVDCPPGSGDFINAAAAFVPVPQLSPESLLAEAKALERRFGRDGAWQRNAPRPLDLDVLAFGGEMRSTAAFTLPHPRATERAFVLVPLAEIVPALVWPGRSETVQQLLAMLDSDEAIERLA